MPYVLLCTGSRELADASLVDQVLDAELAAHPDLCIRVGDCRRREPKGADYFVEQWARRAWGPQGWLWRCRVYKAHWYNLGDYAGPERNGRMVRDGADRCASWWEPPPAENKGTAGCVKLAEAAGIEVVRYGWTPPPAEHEQETLPI